MINLASAGGACTASYACPPNAFLMAVVSLALLVALWVFTVHRYSE